MLSSEAICDPFGGGSGRLGAAGVVGLAFSGFAAVDEASFDPPAWGAVAFDAAALGAVLALGGEGL
jgi:hypothetical protein